MPKTKYQQAHDLLEEITQLSAKAARYSTAEKRIPLFDVTKLESLIGRLVTLVSLKAGEK